MSVNYLLCDLVDIAEVEKVLAAGNTVKVVLDPLAAPDEYLEVLATEGRYLTICRWRLKSSDLAPSRRVLADHGSLDECLTFCRGYLSGLMHAYSGRL